MYTLIEEKDIKKFYDEVIYILNKNETFNNFLIGMLEAGLDEKKTNNWILGKILNVQNEIELIIVCNNFNKMMFFSPTNNNSEQLFYYVAEIIYERHKDKVRIICGEPLSCERFAKKYEKVANLKSEVTMNIKGLVLNKLNYIDTKNLTIRKATMEDYDILYKNEYNCHIDVYGEIPNEELVDRNVNIFLKCGTYLLEDNNIVVSQAVFRRKISIGGVYTPKEYRNRGYSTICTYLLAKKILDKGVKQLVIHTDSSNTVSNYIYEKIGFKYKFQLANIVFKYE